MRIKRALTIGALLLMSTSLTACGGDDKDQPSEKTSTEAGKPGSEAGGEEKSGGLPSASDIASIEYFLNKSVGCLDLMTGRDYDKSSLAEREPAWGDSDMLDNPAWGIKERAVCKDKYDDIVTLLLTPDMKQFQTTLKEKGYSGILVGKDFALDPDDSQTTHELKSSGLMYLSCDPEAEIPSGYQQEPALVDGCLLTDYFPS
ncbi:hypothetical protein E4N62_15490 [Streptomyces sp. MNU76]|uniref:hypothetical protein n=1 Tax=Streptomyces sp. MNU76 TaxID=2560026 RepID=UPI001E50A354|nr:hypothetical protein [Streptomyces sp. MNU76]MCC9706551.1 hypothetical protein [Streptomyces sp. MNU76]